MGVAYVEHPVSKKQKEAFLKQGFKKIIDIRFAPKVLEGDDKKFPKKKAEVKAEAKAAESFNPNTDTVES